MKTFPKRVRATLIVVHDGNILVIERKKKGLEYFVFPGRGVETGETVTQALVREAREETSLEVNPLRLVYKVRFDDDTEHHFYLCEYISGEPRLARDSPEAARDTENTGTYKPRWIPLKDLPKTLLYSIEIRDWVIADAKKNFEGVYREAFLCLRICGKIYDTGLMQKFSSRPITTLFMLSSVDGKISTGDSDVLDVDNDFPKIKGIREGLPQYYELEKWTDLASLNSGRVQSKIGVNTRKNTPPKIPVDFIIIDSKPHLKARGIDYLLKRGKRLFIVTTNLRHPAFGRKDENLIVIHYPKQINFGNLFSSLKNNFGIKRLTIQTGGTLNAVLLRAGLIDHVSIVVAPALIGGRTTSSLVDGESLHSPKELKNIKALKLRSSKILKNSYLHLRYDVIR